MKITYLRTITIVAATSLVFSGTTSSDTKSNSRSFSQSLNHQDDFGNPRTNFYPETPHYAPSNLHDVEPPYSFHVNQIPSCSNNVSELYCVVDREYPIYEALETFQKYRDQILESFGAPFVLDTEKSVDTLTKSDEETFLCPTTVQYAKLLRAMDIDGRWRIILNVSGFQQVVRLETCSNAGSACPAIASCFTTRCIQKYVFQRLVVYNLHYYNYYNPFSIATFKLPSSCCCKTG